MKLSGTQIRSLIEKKEDERVEFKRASSELPDNIWETYSAFSNTDGGTIVLGIREEKNKRYSIEGVANAHKLIDDFWASANNPEKVSYSIFFGHYVYPVKCGRKTVVVIEVPRAPREARPVYVGEDVFKGSFRRNGEGDYHCSREAVKAMLRDQCAETADMCVLDELLVSDLNAETIKRYRGRRGIVVEKHFRTITFSNPGTMRVSKSVAVAGGTSDARNSAIFNIFALVDIGERSGMGLANLHGLWKKYGYTEPKITESYDPDRTVLVVTTDDDTVNDTVTRPENGSEPDQNPTRSAPKVPQECPNGAPRGDIKVDNNAEGDNKVDINTVRTTDPYNTRTTPVQQTRTTPVQHPYNETQSRTIPGQEPNEADFPELQDVSSSAQRVFRALREDGSLTIRGLSSKLSLNKDTVCVAIGILVKAGIIIRVGSKTYGGHWEIAKR